MFFSGRRKKISHGTQEHDFFKTMISEVESSGFTSTLVIHKVCEQALMLSFIF